MRKFLLAGTFVALAFPAMAEPRTIVQCVVEPNYREVMPSDVCEIVDDAVAEMGDQHDMVTNFNTCMAVFKRETGMQSLPLAVASSCTNIAASITWRRK